MDTYKIYINDRNYTSWEVFETQTFQKVDITVDPNASKLFSNDVFSYEKNAVTIVHSSVRSTSKMPAVLIISGNKT
jgi:hypothetical protein